MRRSSTNFYNDIRVVGIDLDQTLYPKSPEIDRAIQEYILLKIQEHTGQTHEEAERAFTALYKGGRGLGGTQTLRALGIPDASEVIQEALERAPIAEFLKPNRAVHELLRSIKSRYKNFDLITSSNVSNTSKKLECLGIEKNIFSHIIDGNQASKSDGSAYRLWLSYYKNRVPGEFLYIGDRPSSDFEAPKKLGIKTILVNRAKIEEEYDCLQLPSLEALAEYI